MKNEKDCLLIIKELVNRKVVTERELATFICGNIRSLIKLKRRINNLREFGFNIGFRKFKNKRLYYLK